MDRRHRLLALILLATVSVASPQLGGDDGCTRELWEQRSDGQMIQVRRNICGGPAATVHVERGTPAELLPPGTVPIVGPLAGETERIFFGPPAAPAPMLPFLATSTVATPPSTTTTAAAPMQPATATTAAVPPAPGTETTTVAPIPPTTPATAVLLPAVVGVAPVPPPPAPSAGISPGLLLLLKKLKLLAVGALLLG
jgi:hypothetical protein